MTSLGRLKNPISQRGPICGCFATSLGRDFSVIAKDLLPAHTRDALAKTGRCVGRRVRKLRRMKQKYTGDVLHSLVELGREQGYLTFDQINDFLPHDVSLPTDLRAVLESFQDMNIKVLGDGPANATEGEAEDEDGSDETATAAPAADSI